MYCSRVSPRIIMSYKLKYSYTVGNTFILGVNQLPKYWQITFVCCMLDIYFLSFSINLPILVLLLLIFPTTTTTTTAAAAAVIIIIRFLMEINTKTWNRYESVI